MLYAPPRGRGYSAYSRAQRDREALTDREVRAALANRARTRIIRKQRVLGSANILPRLHREMGQLERVENAAGPYHAHSGEAVKSGREDTLVNRLLVGKGVSSYDMDGLIELCGRCKFHFLASSLRSHVLVCSGPNTTQD